MTDSNTGFLKAELEEDRTIQVLHVDDDYGFLKTATEMLEMQGDFQVDTATSVQEALDKLGSGDFDVVVSDYLMPDRDGLEFLEELRDQGNDVPFIVFTGKGKEEVAIEALNLGADRYLQKHGDPETVYGELAHSIRQAVEKRVIREKLEAREENFRIFLEGFQGIAYQVKLGGLEDEEELELSLLQGNVEGVTGYTAEDILSGAKPWQEIIHPEDLHFVIQEIRKVLSHSDYVSDEEFRILHKEGETRWVRSISRGSQTEKILQGTIYDITERRLVEEALKESERKHRLLAENTTDVIFIQDMNHKIKYASPSAERLFGYSLERLPELELEDIMTQKSLKRAMKHFKEALQRSKENPDYQIPLMEYEYVRKDGSIFWGEVKVQFLRDQQGNIVGSQGTLRDITERKKSEKMYKAVFENTGTAMCISKADTTITMVNRQFEKLSGYPKEEIEAKMKWTELVSPEHLKMMMKYHRERRCKDGETPRQYTFDFVDKKGNVRNVLITTCLIPGTNKEVASLLDITKEKQKSKVLKQSLERLMDLKEKLEVVGKLTRHDIRNKLSVVNNNLYLAQKQLDDRPEILGYLEEAQSAIKQSTKIFDFAKTYEKLGAGELQLMDVGEAVENAVHPLFSELQEKGIEVENRCKGFEVMADQMLTRLFSNLVYNTLQHGGEQTGSIKVYCQETGENGVELVYEDDGVGIPEEEKEKVFQEGYGKGNGYGIYLANKMCEVYGWTMQETGKLGQGAQFTLTIPRGEK